MIRVMSNDAHNPEWPAPAQSAEPHIVDPRIAVAEMWLCMLGGLMEVARRFSRFLVHEMMPFGAGPKTPFLALRFSGEPVAALKRVMRIARFAAVLYLKIQTQIAAWKAGEPFDLDAFIARTPAVKALSKEGRDAAASDEEEFEDLEDWEDLEEFENLMERESYGRFDILGGSERPVKEDKYVALLKGPLKDAIAAICKELGLKPDWSLWTENGFPTPGSGGVEDWVAFFAPAPQAAPAPRPSRDETPPWASPPPDPRDEAAYQAWRRRWFPPRRYERPPPPPDAGPAPAPVKR
jgi:hypothetical protein